MFVIFSVFYILIAAAMIVLILLQNGAGADAGSGFGGGASATVFGARGSSTFLTRATGVLAALFFLLSLGMGIYLHVNGAPQQRRERPGRDGRRWRRSRQPRRMPLRRRQRRSPRAPAGSTSTATDSDTVGRQAPLRRIRAKCRQRRSRQRSTKQHTCPGGGTGRRTTLRW